MQIRHTDKLVLVTGAATGIGRAIAEAFADSGAKVFINHLNQHDLANDILAHPNIVAAFSADVGNKKAVEQMIGAISSSHGAIDILINNAGISQPQPFLEIEETQWDKTFDTNVKGTMLCCQSVIPGMLVKGDGNIINIVSELGYLGREHYAAYTASKGALITLTRSLAREFAPSIRVNGIAPGPVLTDLLRNELKTDEDFAREMDIPLKRFAEPEEIASTAVFLSSDHARFYCGDILSPNGGALMR
ncbi:MAG: SDR family NAD(P)-dependent oxidoreductase [Gammaproteobacteria bacterium]